MVMVMDRQTKITKQYTPIVHAFAISLGQKWQRTQVTKTILGANEVRQHAPMGPSSFFLGGMVGVLELLVQMDSQHVCQVPNVSPQHVPNSSSLYPISFGLSSNLVIYINQPKWEDYKIFNLGLFEAFFFIFGDGPIKDAHHKRNKILWKSPITN